MNQLNGPILVTDMSHLFKNCKKLDSLDLSSFNTSIVINMEEMFSHIGAKELDLRNFNTLNVQNFNLIFDECYDLNLTLHKINCANMKNIMDNYDYVNVIYVTDDDYYY